MLRYVRSGASLAMAHRSFCGVLLILVCFGPLYSAVAAFICIAFKLAEYLHWTGVHISRRLCYLVAYCPPQIFSGTTSPRSPIGFSLSACSTTSGRLCGPSLHTLSTTSLRANTFSSWSTSQVQSTSGPMSDMRALSAPLVLKASEMAQERGLRTARTTKTTTRR